MSVSLVVALRKAVIPTPVIRGEGGAKVDWDKVPPGASVWITLKTGPLAGRHLLVTKRPDGKVAVVGGPGGTAYRHFAFAPGETIPKATEKDIERKAEARRLREEQKPLIEQVKRLRAQKKEQMRALHEEFLGAVGIEKKEMSRAEIEALKQQALGYAESMGLEGEAAIAYANAVARGARELDRKLKRHIAAKRKSAFEKMLTHFRREYEAKQVAGEEAPLAVPAEGAELTEEEVHTAVASSPTSPIFQELTEEERQLLRHDTPVAVKLPEIAPGKTVQEVQNEVGNYFDDVARDIEQRGVQTVAQESAVMLQTPQEVVTVEPGEAPEFVQEPTSYPMLPRVGEGAAPVVAVGAVERAPEPVLEAPEKLKETLETFDRYMELKAQEREIARQIQRIPHISITAPTALEAFRAMEAAIPKAQVEKLRAEYENALNVPSATAFYSAVSEHWNDELGNTLAEHINQGASSALTGLLGDFLKTERFEIGRVIEQLGVEAGAYTMAFYLRRNLPPEKYEALLQKLREENPRVLMEAEKAALKEHERLVAQFDEIQRQKGEGSLNDDAITACLEAENLLLQRKNLGFALGSMSMTSALLVSMEQAKKGDIDDRVVLSVAGDYHDALEKVEALKLKLNTSAIVYPDTKAGGFKIATSARKLQRFVGHEVRRIARNGAWEKIKNDTSDTSGFADPFFKKRFFDDVRGEWEDHKWRLEQRNDINWLEHAGGGVVARVVGAGKTNTALGFIGRRLTEDPTHVAVCVVPKGRVDQWMHEAQKFTELPMVKIPEGTNQEERKKLYAKYGAQRGVVFVTSHRDASFDHEFIGAVKPDTMVVDEPQLMVTGKARLSAGARRIFKLPAKHRIALTATIARMKPVEAYNLINWTNPGELGYRTRFERAYGGFGSGVNAQDRALENMLWHEIEPYVSAGRQTKASFQVQQKEVTVRRTPSQIARQKEITAGADAYIERRVAEERQRLVDAGKDPSKMPGWKKRARQKAMNELTRMHHNNLHGGDFEHNAKAQALRSEIQGDLDTGRKKHVIFVDSPEQRRAVVDTLRKMGFKTTAIKNITGTAKGAEVEARKKAWKQMEDAGFIIIDKTSAAGHNLQEGDVLHVLGSPQDAAEYLQAQGRLAREPRVGDVHVKTYLHEDSPFEALHWDHLRSQLKLTRATAPHMVKSMTLAFALGRALANVGALA